MRRLRPAEEDRLHLHPVEADHPGQLRQNLRRPVAVDRPLFLRHRVEADRRQMLCRQDFLTLVSLDLLSWEFLLRCLR